MDQRNIFKDVLYGVAVGDALGVPLEFKSRKDIAQNPVTDMIGYGTYKLPAGTFSDDSSLTLCLADALTQEFNLNLIADNFIAWLNDNYWTAAGEVFDVGIATRLCSSNTGSKYMVFINNSRSPVGLPVFYMAMHLYQKVGYNNLPEKKI